MLSITATKLRNNLFSILDKLKQGHVIAINRNGKEIGRLIPTTNQDWRKKVKNNPRLLMSPDKAFEPIDGLWEGYLE
jgi:prevent-host-death family protein